MCEREELFFLSQNKVPITEQSICLKKVDNCYKIHQDVQKENIWRKLHLRWTDSFKKRASVTKCEPSNNDSLDLKLNALYSHHHQWLETSAGIMLQPNTVKHKNGLCKESNKKKNQIKKDKGMVNYGIRNYPIYIATLTERRKNINTNKSMAIESSHISQTKNGYDRNKHGGFFDK
ncbi:protein CFAP276-like [Centruroides vittatus]|uniref:protein CFAP276-like n=1 Tax=Centruroides vittatus TaxID=120091 RepID=UPI00350FB266